MKDFLTEGRELISRYVAGAVSPEEITRMDALVESHPELREELERQSEMDIALAVTAARRPDAFSKPKPVPFPVQKPKSAKLFPWLAAAAALALLGGMWWREPPAAGPTVVVHQPGNLFTTPLLNWENKGDQLFDVWILPKGADQATTKPLFKGENLRPPLAFDQLIAANDNGGITHLTPGGEYALLVCLADTDRMAGTMVTFQLSPAAVEFPKSPAAAFLQVQKFLESGDQPAARSFLDQLPAEWQAMPEFKSMRLAGEGRK
jgi:hypothetical protein